MHRSLVLLGLWGVSLGCSQAPRAATAAAPMVRPGIEVLLSDSMSLVRGRRVGLVTNQSGVDSRGTSDVTRLREAGVDLVALFSPEHGFRGAAEPGAAVASSRDSATGLPIYSLYGPTSAPTDAMLDGLNVILIDLQDAGARYFTYLYTAVEVMKAAGRRAHRCRRARPAQPDRRGGAGKHPPARVRVAGGLSRRADASRDDAGRAGPAGPGRSAGCRFPRRRTGGRVAAGDGLRPDRAAVHSAESQPPVARESLSLSRDLPLRGHQPVGGPRIGRAIRADRRSVARHDACPRLHGRGQAAGRAVPRGTVHPGPARRRQVRGYGAGGNPAHGDRPGYVRPHGHRRVPAGRRSRLRRWAASPGSRSSSTGWPADPRSALALESGVEPSTIVRAWGPGLQKFKDRRRQFLLYPE